MAHSGKSSLARSGDKSASKRSLGRTGADTEALIVATSIRLFTAHGFDRVTTRMIAEECAITVPTIYLYFKDKRALYLHCSVDVFGRNTDLLLAAMAAAPTPDERILAGARQLAKTLLEDPDIGRLFQRELADTDVESLGIINRKTFRRPLEALHGHIEEALGRPPPPLAAMSIFALTFGFFQYMQVTDEVMGALSGPDPRPDQLARHVLRIGLPEIHDRLFKTG